MARPTSGTEEESAQRDLQAMATLLNPRARVWRGDQTSSTREQGLFVPGTPLGHADFCEISPQAARLLLSYCRANFVLRTVRPELAMEGAASHDQAIRRCMTQILGIHAETVPELLPHQTASLPLSMGGLGLRSALRCHRGAHWASWADGIEMINQRHPVNTTPQMTRFLGAKVCTK